MATSVKKILSKIIHLQECWDFSYEIPLRVKVGDKYLDLEDSVELKEINNDEGHCLILKVKE